MLSGDRSKISNYRHKVWLNTLAHTVHELGVQNIDPDGACHQGMEKAPEYPRLFQRSPAAGPLVYCVEPLPGNSRVLIKAATAAPWKGALKVIDAAVVGENDLAVAGETYIPFPNFTSFGREDLGVKDKILTEAETAEQVLELVVHQREAYDLLVIGTKY